VLKCHRQRLSFSGLYEYRHGLYDAILLQSFVLGEQSCIPAFDVQYTFYENKLNISSHGFRNTSAY
jgi:hypothetical protein